MRRSTTGGGAAPAARATLSRPQIVAALTLLVVGVAGAATWGWQQAGDNAARTRLTAPPVSAPAVIVAHLSGMYETAQRQPRSIAAVGPLCLAYHADMFFGPAERCYDLAIDLAPADWRWGYYRALIDADRGGSPALVARLRAVAEANPAFGPAWLRIGDAEFKAGNYQGAAAAWQRAQALAEPTPVPGEPPHRIEIPLAAHAGLGLARVALVRGDAAGAVRVLEPVLGQSAEFGAAWRLIGEAYRAAGKELDAARAIARAGRLPAFAPYADPMVDALARESRNSTLLLRMASEATLSVNAEWSQYLTRRALEFDPSNPEAVLKMGRVLRTFNREADALPYFRKYHELVPGDYQVLAQIGTSLSALGRFDEAAGYFKEALKGVDDAITHYNLGLLMSRTGRLDAAAVSYQRALDRDPYLSDARSNLATVFARQGRLDRAVDALTRLLADEPENPLALTNLGLIRFQQGRLVEARRELEAALQIAPGMTQAAEALEAIGAAR